MKTILEDSGIKAVMGVCDMVLKSHGLLALEAVERVKKAVDEGSVKPKIRRRRKQQESA